MSVATSQEIGTALCKALGIDQSYVKAVELRCAVGEISTVRVTSFVDEAFSELTGLDVVTREYMLVERTEIGGVE